MTRSHLFVIVAAAFAVGPLPTAFGQPVPPMGAQRPRYSPYMGLLAGTSNPGLNYLGIVRPQQQFQQQANQLSQQIRQQSQTLQDLNTALVYGVDPNLPLTGHGAVFNYTGHYFNSNPAYGGGSGAGGRMGGGFAGGVGAFNTFNQFGGGRGGSFGNLPSAGMGGAASARYSGVGRTPQRQTSTGGRR